MLKIYSGKRITASYGRHGPRIVKRVKSALFELLKMRFLTATSTKKRRKFSKFKSRKTYPREPLTQLTTSLMKSSSKLNDLSVRLKSALVVPWHVILGEVDRPLSFQSHTKTTWLFQDPSHFPLWSRKWNEPQHQATTCMGHCQIKISRIWFDFQEIFFRYF